MRTKPDRSNAIPPEPHAKLLAELEGFEHLLFEPMTQADLDQLYALSESKGPGSIYFPSHPGKDAQPQTDPA